MPEIGRPVHKISHSYICDECGEGEMLPIEGGFFDTTPPRYEHKCTKCGHREVYPIKYPFESEIVLPVVPADQTVMDYEIQWDQIHSMSQVIDLLQLHMGHIRISPQHGDEGFTEAVLELEKEGLIRHVR